MMLVKKTPTSKLGVNGRMGTHMDKNENGPSDLKGSCLKPEAKMKSSNNTDGNCLVVSVIGRISGTPRPGRSKSKSVKPCM